MGDLVVSGWLPTNVKVLRQTFAAGALPVRENVVRLVFHADSFAAANLAYPTNGIPLPGPALVGLQRIDYVIPICPLIDARAAATNFQRYGYVWGAYLPCGGISGATSARGPISMRLLVGVPKVSGSGATDFAGTNPSLGTRSHFREATTDIGASNISPTAGPAGYITYAVFGEM